jgi:hypothetical protein
VNQLEVFALIVLKGAFGLFDLVASILELGDPSEEGFGVVAVKLEGCSTRGVRDHVVFEAGGVSADVLPRPAEGKLQILATSNVIGGYSLQE